MPNGISPSSSAKVEVHVEKEKPANAAKEESYAQLPPRFMPKEGYELIGTLVKSDPILTKYLLRLLKGVELIQDEDSPTGFREKEIRGTKTFCNSDGVDKIIDFVILHINTPLSYKEGNMYNSQPPSQIAGKIAKQFIKDLAANYERWDINNPSLIPQIAALLFNYVKAAQGQQTELPEGLLAGGALRPKTVEKQNDTRSPHRLSI